MCRPVTRLQLVQLQIMMRLDVRRSAPMATAVLEEVLDLIDDSQKWAFVKLIYVQRMESFP